MKERGRPLSFLWRFTLVLLAVSAFSAFALAFTIEAAHRHALETDIMVTALGRVNEELTKPLDELGRTGALTRSTERAIEAASNDALLSEYVTAMRVYRPSGVAIYPTSAPPRPAEVHRALATDNFVAVESGDTITAYSPCFTEGEQVFVIAVDFSTGQMGTGFQRERNQVFMIVGAVVAIIFLSLVTLAAGASRELELRRRESQRTFVQTLKVMAETIDLRDPYTAGHSQRVAVYSRKLAEAAGLPRAQVDVVENGALLHDIGKIAIPDAVLFKPAHLDQRERAIIGTHPVVGAKLLEQVSSMEDIVPCVMHHHERIDGTGYPDKLAGESIPCGARIIAIADTFDAMTTDRPYRRGLSVETTVAELRRVAGRQLDAKLVAIFIDLIGRGQVEVLQPPRTDGVEVVFGRKAELEIAPV